MGYNTEIRRKRRSPGRFWLHFGGQVTLGLLAFDLLQLAQAPPFAALSTISAPDSPTLVCDINRNVTLPDGQTVAIRDISYAASNGRMLVWDTDGRLIAEPTRAHDRTEFDVNATPGTTYHALVSVASNGKDIPQFDVGTASDSPLTASLIAGGEYNGANQTRTASVQLNAPTSGVPGGRGAFLLGVSSRQWYTIAEEPLPGRIGRNRGPELDIRLADRSGKQQGFSAVFHLPAELAVPRGSDGRSRLTFLSVAVDWMGRPHLPRSSGGSNRSRDYQAFFQDLSPEMVYSIRLIAAPMQWIKFANLPLDYNHAREILPRSYPITRATVDRAWTNAVVSGKGELIQTTTPLASIQITDPVPDAVVLGLGAPMDALFYGASIGNHNGATYITAYVPEFLTERPFTLTAKDISGRAILLQRAGEAPAREGTRGFVFTSGDLAPRDIRALSLRMQRL